MAKATSKKRNSRADPITRKADNPNTEEKTKQDHLYTDDNRETGLHGTGFKDAATADKTVSLVSRRSLTYQRQMIHTMCSRAKHHPNKTKDIEAAIAVFEKWLGETYPRERAEQRTFKLLTKTTVRSLLPQLKQAGSLDTAFAEMYVQLEARRRLANVLVREKEPGQPDWDRTRVDRLSELVPNEKNNVDEGDLWTEGGRLSQYHLSLVAWGWSPVSEYKLLKTAGD